jgi:hypothetical protein
LLTVRLDVTAGSRLNRIRLPQLRRPVRQPATFDGEILDGQVAE